MKLAENFKRPAFCHPFTRPVCIPDANSNSDLFVRCHSKARLYASLKALEVTNNASAHGKSIRRQDNVIDETAMVQPLFPCGIAINRAQQTNRCLLEA